MGELENRLEAVRETLESHELDALVVNQPQNRRYISGFTGSAGLAVITAEEARMITDSRYFEQVEEQAKHFELERVDGKAFPRLAEVLEELGVTRVGFEADTVTVTEHERLLEAAPNVTWVSTSGLVELLRARKSAAEIDLLRAAIELTDRAMEHAFGVARVGLTERELAWELEAFMRERGAEAMAFEPIVAVGENGALPHHRPTDRRIETGEPIVIDMGAQLDGYCGDLTRTFSLGPAKDLDYERVYSIVEEANGRAIAALRPEMTGPEVDAVARAHITEAGFGDHFGHGLGHGVGLYIHELPRLGAAAGDEPLQSGMVMTIEPGIYLTGRFGVRIEDVVLLRDDGAEVMSRSIKEPIVV